ncbi:MAG TPA: ABC transporter permease [Syntrophorhabdales bacterium]|nr:ABC transporter permease [Syntrophorhabdales bacterium]
MSEGTRVILEEPLPRVNEFRRFVRVFLSRGVVVFGIVTIGLAILAAILAPLIVPYDPYAQSLDSVLQSPSLSHLLGSDSLGRDTLSRIIYGTRITLLVGVGTVLIAACLGTIVGLLAGYFGGWTFTIIMRFTDGIMAVPPLLLALVIAALLGTGVKGVVIAISFALFPGYIRLICGQVLSVKENEYVMAAHSVGVGKVGIMLRHILPNCLSPLIVQMTMMMGLAIITEATLSFLGLGIKPPSAAWGSMVYDGYKYLVMRPILSIAPGVAIALVVFAFNMIGDGLRDAIDPRLRGTL